MARKIEVHIDSVPPYMEEITSRKETEAIVDEDITDFDKWFQQLDGGNDPIVKVERAILKTYLWYKLTGGQRGTATGS